MSKKKVGGYIEHWFDQNIDQETRTIYMGSITKSQDDWESGVDNFMAEYFIKGMHILNSISDKPITVIMNNPGGDWYHGMAIYDAIETSRSHVTILVYGHAMSMGSIILQAADHRVMMPNSRFMIHFGYDGRYGHTKIFEKWADESKRINREMENIYLERLREKDAEMGQGYIETTINTIIKNNRQFEIPNKRTQYTISKEDFIEDCRIVLQDMLNYDTILTPQDTVALGWADEIFS